MNGGLTAGRRRATRATATAPCSRAPGPRRESPPRRPTASSPPECRSSGPRGSSARRRPRPPTSAARCSRKRSRGSTAPTRGPRPSSAGRCGAPAIGWSPCCETWGSRESDPAAGGPLSQPLPLSRPFVTLRIVGPVTNRKSYTNRKSAKRPARGGPEASHSGPSDQSPPAATRRWGPHAPAGPRGRRAPCGLITPRPCLPLVPGAGLRAARPGASRGPRPPR